MRRGAAVLLLLVVACGSTMRVEVADDCPGQLAVNGVACPAAGCGELTPGETVSAVDSEECAFVRWTGSCDTARTCPAQNTGTALFRRLAWPLEVDAADAGSLDVAVEPEGSRCDAVCRVWIPVGASAQVVASSATGVVPAFSGDCDAIDGGSCAVLGDRSRRVQIVAAGRSVTVRTHGPGSVRVDAADLDCPADSSCTGLAALDVPIEAVAAPVDSSTDLVTWTAPTGCAGLKCVASELADFDVTFVHRVRLMLTSAGDGSGSVSVNGASEALPYDALLPIDADIAITGVPSVDDVVVGFDALPCTAERQVDECHFQLAATTSGSVRFHRFFDWLIAAGPGATPGDVVARDGGFLLSLDYGSAGPAWLPAAGSRASAVVEVLGDGGIGRATASNNHALQATSLITAPDGGLLVAGSMYQRPIGPSPRASIAWASLDASVPDRSQPEFAVLEFDEARFEPTRFSYPASTYADSRVTLPAHDVVGVGEGLGASPLIESGGTTDAGVQAAAQYSLASWSEQMNLQGLEPLPSTTSSLASTSMGPSMLFLARTALPAVSCTATLDALPYLTRVSPTLACNGLVEASPALPGRVYAASPLLSHRDTLFFETVAESTTTGLTTPSLHRFDAALTRDWEVALLPVQRRPPQPDEKLEPARLLAEGNSLVALWAVRGNSVAAIRSADGLTVSCPESGDTTTTHLLITTHDAQTGKMRWGICLPGAENAVDRFGGFESSALSSGTVLVPGQAFTTSSTPVPTSIHFGSHPLPVPTTVGYLLAIRPPLE